MNILLVDDDKYLLDGIVSRIDWDSLGAEELFPVRSARQAREILSQYPIDVMVCDIEMPNESGLALLSWARRNLKLPLQVIFLTGYAEFDYAREAVALGSFSYLLKPVDDQELTDNLRQAIARSREEKRRQTYLEYGKFWVQNSATRRESFWQWMLTRRYPPAAEQLQRQQEKYQLDYGGISLWFITIEAWRELSDQEKKDDAMYEYRFRSIINGVLGEFGEIEAVLWDEDALWQCVIQVHGQSAIAEGIPPTVLTDIANGLEKLYYIIKRDFGITCGIFYSGPFHLPEVLDHGARIRQMRFNNIRFKNGIFFATEGIGEKSDQNSEGVDGLYFERLVQEGNAGELKAYMNRQLESRGHRGGMSREELQNYSIDVMQILFSVLKENHIDAHLLFSSERKRTLYQKSLHSVRDMKEYIDFLIDTAMEQVHLRRQQDDVVDAMCKYIESHFCSQISRNHLAGVFFMNADYLARIFKKKMGISLVAYTTSLRLGAAKKLLETTGSSIAEIAEQVGYPTVHYFSKSFREYYGILPGEIRKQCKEKEEKP